MKRRFVTGTIGLAGALAVVGVIVAAIAVPTVLADGKSGAVTAAAPTDAPKLLAVRFHADWCAKCSQLAPNYSKLVANSRDVPVLFVTLDMTNEVTRRQSQYLAGMLGIGQLSKEQGNRVGVIMLVDATDKMVLSTVGVDGELAQIEKMIRKVVP